MFQTMDFYESHIMNNQQSQWNETMPDHIIAALKHFKFGAAISIQV